MSETAENDPMPSKSGVETILEFHYIKSSQFRVIHSDGMIGGVSPDGESIEMALFSEREPIPQKVIVKIAPDGSTEMVAREGRDGITREVDVNAIMSIETAEMVGSWLLEQVEIAKGLQESQ